MAEDSWYYAASNAQQGPVSTNELRELIATGTVRSETLVWREGMANWSPAGSMNDIFPAELNLAPASPYVAPAPLGGSAAMAGNLDYYRQAPSEVAYGGFWIRVAAYFIDYIVTAIGGLIVGGIVGVFVGLALAGTHNSLEIGRIAGHIGQLLGLFISWLYFALMESSPAQATLGKMAVGLKVTDLNGARITFGRATGRFFGKILSALILCIGFMMVGWTPRKQGLHDQMAGTLVVKK